MENLILENTAKELQHEWGITIPEIIDEKTIIDMLTRRVEVLIKSGPDKFYPLMYRLDISEKKLNAVLRDDNVAYKIAYLIYERQLQKIKSRIEYRNLFDNDKDHDMKL